MSSTASGCCSESDSYMATPYLTDVLRFHARLGDRTLPLGLGCAYIGQAGDADRQREYRETLEQAYEAGIRYYDTAELYGGSEFRVGSFLKTIPRDTVFVATKSRIPDALTPSEAARHVRQNLRSSIERLGDGPIDLYQIHAVDTLDQVLAPGGVLEALVAARDEGAIRYIGLATRWHDLIETATAHGGFDTFLTYLDYTLVDQTAAHVIRFANERGVGVINGTPLANGLLVGTDPRRNTEMHIEVRRYRPLAIRVYDFATAHGVPLLALALQYPMQHPGIAITLTGPANPDQLRSTLEACAFPIPPEVWKALRDTFGFPVPSAA